MKTLKTFSSLVVVLTVVLVLSSFVGCTSPQTTSTTTHGYMVDTKDGKVVLYKEDGSSQVLDDGKLMYALGNGATLTLVIGDRDGTQKIININPESGEKNETDLFQNRDTAMEVMPYKHGDRIWLLFPWEGVAVLIDKNGNVLFNTSEYLPTYRTPWCDCSALHPIYVKENGSAWIEMVGDDYVFLYVDKDGKVVHSLTIPKSGDETLTWKTLGNNLLIALGYNQNSQWQFKILAPDGRTVFDTTTMTDYKASLWFPAGAGSPVYAIYDNTLVLPYIEEDGKLRIIYVTENGNITINNYLGIKAKSTSGELFYIGKDKAEKGVFLLNLYNDDMAQGESYLISENKQKNLDKYVSLVANVGNIAILATSENKENKFYTLDLNTWKMTPLESNQDIDGKVVHVSQLGKNWVFLYTDKGITYGIRNDGKIFHLIMTGDQIVKTIPANDHIYVITKDASDVYYLYDVDSEGLPHPVLSKLTVEPQLSTQPFFSWHLQTGATETYANSTYQIDRAGGVWHVKSAPKGLSIYAFVSTDYNHALALLIKDGKVIFTKEFHNDFSRIYSENKQGVVYSLLMFGTGDMPGTFMYIATK